MSNQQVSKPISSIIVVPAVNTRQVADATVIEYAESMKVYGEDDWQTRWGGQIKITADFHLWAGFHTLEAARRAFGDDHLVNCIVEGDNLRNAFLNASGENATHGRARNNPEKKASVLRWLLDDHHKTYTDGYIAEKCGVSQNFVSSVCNELKGDLSELYIPPEAFPDGVAVTLKEYTRPSKRKYLRAGKFQYIETEEIGNKPKPKPPKVDEMIDNLYKHTSFSTSSTEQIVADQMMYFHVPEKTAQSQVEHYSSLRDLVMKEVDDYYTEIVKLCPGLQAGRHTEPYKAILKLYPDFRGFGNQQHLAVVHLEGLRNVMIEIRDDLKENTIEAIVKTAFPGGIPNEEGKSNVNWDPPSDLPETQEELRLVNSEEEAEALLSEVSPLPDSEPQGETDSSEVDMQEPDHTSDTLSMFDKLSEGDKQDIALVEGHIANMLEVAGLPKYLEIAANHLRHAIDAYREGNELRFFLTENPVATIGDTLEELGYVKKVETSEAV